MNVNPSNEAIRLNEHVHNEAEVYPSLADGVLVAGGAGVWELGAFVEIVPASTITNWFDIHGIIIEDMSATDVYEIVLYHGAGDTFAGRTKVVKSANQDTVQFASFMTKVIPANDRIRAKLASASGGDDATISIFYHQYD